MTTPARVVIVGGGFGGIAAAQALRRVPVSVTLIDRRNHHLFQPLLYQVATASLAPADIAEPIRSILRRQANAEVVLGEAGEVDLAGKRIRVGDAWIAWDWLILAAGARHSYFGHAEWESHAPGLKSIGDALEIRRRMLLAFEQAEWEEDDAKRRRLLTFVVIGAGATGVEVAGAIADIAHQTLKRDFKHIDTKHTQVVLVEAGPKVLGVYDDPLPEKARLQLVSLGVDVRLNTRVTAVDKDGVDLDGERLPAATVVWAAGVAASPVGSNTGWSRDRSGRVVVHTDLSVPNHPQVFVIGDQASVTDGNGVAVPGLAPAALQMGAHAAKNIRADLKGAARTPFRYKDRGSMATIGRARAIAQAGPLRLSGFIAWLAWVFIHILTLVTFRNRLIILVKWAWAWAVSDRSSRLLWESEPSAHIHETDVQPGSP